MVGDYLFQTDWQARNKRGGLSGDRVARRALFTHVTTYTLAFVPAFIWIGDELDAGWAIARRRARLRPAPVIDDGRLVRALPRPRQARRGLRRRARGVGRPVVPRALAVPRGAAGRERHEPPPPRAGSLLLAVAVARGGGRRLVVRRPRAAFDAARAGAVDARFDVRGAQAPPSDIVIVGDRRQDARASPRTVRSTASATRGSSGSSRRPARR